MDLSCVMSMSPEEKNRFMSMSLMIQNHCESCSYILWKKTTLVTNGYTGAKIGRDRVCLGHRTPEKKKQPLNKFIGARCWGGSLF